MSKGSSMLFMIKCSSSATELLCIGLIPAISFILHMDASVTCVQLQVTFNHA